MMHLAPSHAQAWLKARLRLLQPSAIEVDVAAIAEGADTEAGGSGCCVIPGPQQARFTSSAIDATRNLLVDGSCVIDGLFFNDSYTLIWGDLVANCVVNQGLLVVAGDIHCERFLGIDHEGGVKTACFGRFSADEVVTRFGHLIEANPLAATTTNSDDADPVGTSARLAAWGIADLDFADSLEVLAKAAAARGPVSVRPSFALEVKAPRARETR